MGSGGEMRAPRKRAANHIAPLFSTIDLLSTSPDLIRRTAIIGTWNPNTEEK
jgi:hypothetical protein